MAEAQLRMGYMLLISVIPIVVISYREGKGRPHPNAIVFTGEKMTHDPVFTVAAFGILGITAALYAIFR